MDETGRIVGRTPEIELVAAALRDRTASGVILHGPRGVGKTHLARACLATMAADGAVVAQITATAASRDVPLGALAPLLPALDSNVNPLGAARRALLAHRPPGKPLVLLADDAQWLDDTSGALIHQLAVEREVFVLLTARDDEPLPDSVRALWKDDIIRRIEVSSLLDPEIVAVAELSLGGPVSTPLAAEVVRLAEGNPLMAREILVGARETGIVVARGDVWDLDAPLGRTPALVDLVGGRLDRLDDDERRALELVALGEPLPIDALDTVDELVLERLETLGLITSRADGLVITAWLAHPLYGEVLLQAMAPEVRAEHLGSLAESLERTALDDDNDALRVALWSLEIGRSTSKEILTRGAHWAFATHRFDTATDLLLAVDDFAHDPDIRFDAASAMLWIDRADEAEAILLDAATRPKDDADRARIARLRATLRQSANDLPTADAILAAALDEVAEPDARLGIEMQRGLYALAQGAVDSVITVLEPIIDSLDDTAFVVAGETLAHLYVFIGRPVDGADLADRAYGIHQRLWLEDPAPASYPSHPSGSLMAKCIGLATAGRIADALALARDADRFEERVDVLHAHRSLIRGYASLRAGDLTTAVAALTRAMHHYERTTPAPGQLFYISAALASAAAAQNGAIDEARALYDHSRRADVAPLLGAYDGIARGWILAATHDTDDATDAFVGAIDTCLAAGNRLFAIEALSALARVGRPDLAMPRVDELRAGTQGEILAAWLDHIEAKHRGDAVALDAIADRLEAIGARHDARVVRADAMACTGRGAAARATVRPTDVALTEREREIATLAAGGMTAKEIGAALGISPRTASNHLQRVYGKLGVSSRRELAAALGVSPPST